MHCRKVNIACWLIVLASLLYCSNRVLAKAPPLGSQYTVNVSATAVGVNEYRFEYDIFNNTDQLGAQTGFDEFFLAVPANVPISSINLPPTATWASDRDTSPAFFDSSGNYPGTWFRAAGMGTGAVYPVGSEAVISFVADNCIAGTVNAGLVSYWNQQIPTEPFVNVVGANYTLYTTTLTGPLSIPEPSAIGILCFAAVRGLRRYRAPTAEQDHRAIR